MTKSFWRTGEGDQRGGEWETIKILQRNLAYITKIWCPDLLTRPRQHSYRKAIDPRNRVRNHSGNTNWCRQEHVQDWRQKLNQNLVHVLTGISLNTLWACLRSNQLSANETRKPRALWSGSSRILPGWVPAIIHTQNKQGSNNWLGADSGWHVHVNWSTTTEENWHNGSNRIMRSRVEDLMHWWKQHRTRTTALARKIQDETELALEQELAPERGPKTEQLDLNRKLSVKSKPERTCFWPTHRLTRPNRKIAWDRIGKGFRVGSAEREVQARAHVLLTDSSAQQTDRKIGWDRIGKGFRADENHSLALDSKRRCCLAGANRTGKTIGLGDSLTRQRNEQNPPGACSGWMSMMTENRIGNTDRWSARRTCSWEQGSWSGGPWWWRMDRHRALWRRKQKSQLMHSTTKRIQSKQEK
jgi:hypothetical protein